MSRSQSIVGLVLLLMVGVVLCQTPVDAQGIDRRELFGKNIKGCVGVMTAGGPASGFIVDSQKRWIVTCQHVVGTRDEVEIIFPAYKDGRLIQDRSWYLKNAPRIKAKVLSADTKRDLSLVQAESLPPDAVALRMATESGQPGDALNLIGNPAASGAMWNYSIGSLRAVYEKKFTYKNTTHEVDAVVGETQLPANPGDSGGAVFNDHSEVLGVHSGGTPDGIQLMATYIDIVEVRKFISEPFKAALRPSTFDEFWNIANDAFRQGENDKALEAYTQAIKIKPEYSESYRCRASTLIRKRQYDKAIEDCNSAISLDKLNSKAYNERAVCHGAKGELKAALADYSEAVRINPKDPMYLAGRAWTYNGLLEYSKAIDDATEAIKLRKDYALALSERATAYFALKDYAKAVPDLDQALALNPKDAKLLLSRSACHKSLGHQSQADADLRQAQELDAAIARSSKE